MSRILDVKKYFDPLFTYVNQYTKIGKEELVQLIPFLSIRLFEKRSVILHAGEIEDHLSIVMKGMARKYMLGGDNREITLELFTEGHLIHSETSFSLRTPSETGVQAIEQTILIRLEYKNMGIVLRKFPWVETAGRLLTMHVATMKEKRMYDLRMKSPRQRLQELLKVYPAIFRRLPQHMLASWLNIKPETLSRLKKELKK